MSRSSGPAGVFSVSAVDLFASTLGAFVVLTMILLPLRSQEPPVPSPADPDAAEVREALRTARGMLDQARDRVSELEASGTATAEAMGAARERVAELEALLAVAREALEQRVSATASSPQTASAPEAPLGAIDLVVVLDTTASMWAVIESLSADIAAVGAVLVALTADPAVAIIDFKDGCGGVPALRLTPLQPLAGPGLSRIQAFIDSMSAFSARCNTTPDEDLGEALFAAVDVPWRPHAVSRAVVLVSDNPAHPALYQRVLAVASAFHGRSGGRHTVSTVFVDTSAFTGSPPGLAAPEILAWFGRLAEAGGGRSVFHDTGESLGLTILRAVAGI